MYRHVQEDESEDSETDHKDLQSAATQFPSWRKSNYKRRRSEAQYSAMSTKQDLAEKLIGMDDSAATLMNMTVSVGDQPDQPDQSTASLHMETGN